MALGDEPKIPEFGVKQTQAPSKKFDLKEVVSFFKTLALFLAAAFILRASVVEAYKIPSGSMKPTLTIGDQILVSKLAYGLRLPLMTDMLYQYRNPERGDVVVFTRPDEPETLEDESAINIIKRVIGLPGDHIEVKRTELYINGQLYPEDYVRWEENGLVQADQHEWIVPPGHVFLMGDNRDHSKDSRFWGYPFLPMTRIKGKAFLIYWSWDSLNRIGEIIR